MTVVEILVDFSKRCHHPFLLKPQNVEIYCDFIYKSFYLSFHT